MSTESIPPFFSDRVTLRTVVERAEVALRTQTGFSLVRLGDGEGPMLCWPEIQRPGEMATVLTTWFGRSDFSDADLQIMADGLRQAVRSADVLGLPTRYQLTRSPRYGMVFAGIEPPLPLFAVTIVHGLGRALVLAMVGSTRAFAPRPG